MLFFNAKFMIDFYEYDMLMMTFHCMKSNGTQCYCHRFPSFLMTIAIPYECQLLSIIGHFKIEISKNDNSRYAYYSPLTQCNAFVVMLLWTIINDIIKWYSRHTENRNVPLSSKWNGLIFLYNCLLSVLL